MSLTREQIQAADDRPRELVTVPQWGGDVWVASMTAGEKAAWEAGIMALGKENKLDNVRVRLAIRTVEDDAGKPLFTDADIPWLTNKSAAALECIFPVAARLNALTKSDEDELLKNSLEVPHDSSSSASPATLESPSGKSSDSTP